MANTTKPLTNTEVKQAKPREKEYNLADGGGLALRVKPNGNKFWLFNYSNPHTKKRTNIGFGSYPDVSLADARRKKEAARTLLANNVDPKYHKEQTAREQKEAMENTFGVVAEKWYQLKLKEVKKETADKSWQILSKHALPAIESTPIHQLKPKMVIDILKPIEAKGSRETVKRLCRTINEVMRIALASGLIEVNYLTDITKLFAAPQKKNMVTITPDRLPELMQNLARANIMLVTRCLVEWQLHTMTRPAEAAKAKWEEIDLEKQVWVIPAERMKMGRPHTIPLTPQTLSLLELLKPISGHRTYLFPSHRNAHSHANTQSANMALKRIGFAGELVSHGLRALASTTLNEQGFDPDVIESALAHVDRNEVRRAYNRAEYLERRRKLMCWWSQHIEDASTGNVSLSNSKQALRLVNQ
ncbi:MAG: integrase domain-containing protein [Aliiglaciecola sp.]